MTIQQAQQTAVSQLRLLYEEREAGNIADWVLEHITAKKRIDRLVDKQVGLTNTQQEKLENILQQLATHKPIQYVLNEAWFAGLRFFVNGHVLIPRPETEELVEWIVEEIKKSTTGNGTGSGCIPVSVKKKHTALSVMAVDVSEEALQVAQKNAQTLEAEIEFQQIDFLDESEWSGLPVFDIIISNPPYIKQSEERNMSQNVLAFEPSLALFVPDEDALLFYRKIAVFAKEHLAEDGSIFLEINEALGKDVVALYEQNGFMVELRQDMQGKERMVRAFSPSFISSADK
ncbi:MAG: peptide chain release factor N(5)-glutamine methyltransferase [Sediminibacterium sp.]